MINMTVALETVRSTLRSIVAEQLCISPDEASDHDSLSERYQMDSLDQAEIIIAIECDLAIELDLDLSFDTVSQLIEAVEAVA